MTSGVDYISFSQLSNKRLHCQYPKSQILEKADTLGKPLNALLIVKFITTITMVVFAGVCLGQQQPCYNQYGSPILASSLNVS